jgi:hypothetical protein
MDYSCRVHFALDRGKSVAQLRSYEHRKRCTYQAVVSRGRRCRTDKNRRLLREESLYRDRKRAERDTCAALQRSFTSRMKRTGRTGEAAEGQHLSRRPDSISDEIPVICGGPCDSLRIYIDTRMEKKRSRVRWEPGVHRSVRCCAPIPGQNSCQQREVERPARAQRPAVPVLHLLRSVARPTLRVVATT